MINKENAREKYVEIIPFLKSNLGKVVIGNFWYEFKVCYCEVCQQSENFKVLRFGRNDSEFFTSLCHHSCGYPHDTFEMYIAGLQPIIKDGKTEYEKVVLDYYISIKPTLSSNFYQVLAQSNFEDFYNEIIKK